MNTGTGVQLVETKEPMIGWMRGFWFLMGTQFQNAFSDNALKNLVILLVLAQPRSEGERDTLVSLTGALFAIPFILFSMLGGWLADRFSKQRVMVGVKSAEIGIMLFASLALFFHNTAMQLGAVFLMGCHSALFGPSKYAVLPEILPMERLSWGNGILELLTFSGILLGTVAGGLLASSFRENLGFSGVVLTLIAVFGLGMARQIPMVPAANPACRLRINPFTDLWREIVRMRLDAELWRANLGNVGFFFLAALIQMNLVVFAHDVLQLDETRNALLSAALAVGIGIGSLAAGVLSRGKIEYRLVLAGAGMMFMSAMWMGVNGSSLFLFVTLLVLLGVGAGCFIVPLTAVLQQRPAPESKGATQGAASVMSFVGILAASGLQRVLRMMMTSEKIFILCGCTALLIGVYIFRGRRGSSTGNLNRESVS